MKVNSTNQYMDNRNGSQRNNRKSINTGQADSNRKAFSDMLDQAKKHLENGSLTAVRR